jgi:hypothetical protein
MAVLRQKWWRVSVGHCHKNAVAQWMGYNEHGHAVQAANIACDEFPSPFYNVLLTEEYRWPSKQQVKL